MDSLSSSSSSKNSSKICLGSLDFVELAFSTLVDSFLAKLKKKKENKNKVGMTIFLNARLKMLIEVAFRKTSNCNHHKMDKKVFLRQSPLFSSLEIRNLIVFQRM